MQEVLYPYVDSTTQHQQPLCVDSIPDHVILLNKSHDSAVYNGSGFWFTEVMDYFRQRDSFGMIRHSGTERQDRFASESMLLGLLLLEFFLVAFLLKKGLKLIAQHTRLTTSSDADMSGGEFRFISGFSLFLWSLTMVVISLMGHVLLNIRLGAQGYALESGIVLRLVIYTFSFFFALTLGQQFIGSVFFSRIKTNRWIANNTTIYFYYAISLSPVLIGAEIGAITNTSFVFYWTLFFLILSRLWMFYRTIRIFSVSNQDFFYLILYLCGLDILPILLYYKGLFLL